MMYTWVYTKKNKNNKYIYKSMCLWGLFSFTSRKANNHQTRFGGFFVAAMPVNVKTFRHNPAILRGEQSG